MSVLSPARPTALRPERRARAGGGPPRVPLGGGGDGDGGRGGSGGARPWGEGAGELGPFALALVLFGVTTLFLVPIAVWLLVLRPERTGAGAPVPAAALGLSTLLLAAASLALERAARRPAPAARRWLLAGALLGLAFLPAQVHLWNVWLRADLASAAGSQAGVFFALLALHALHVLGGLAFLAWLLQQAPPRPGTLRLAAIYWHYMGAIWLVLFVLLCWLR